MRVLSGAAVHDAVWIKPANGACMTFGGYRMLLLYRFAIAFLACFTAGISGSAVLWAGTHGILDGKIKDKRSGEPLLGVNVVIVGTTFGIASDDGGFYRLANIRAGIYDVQFSLVGYKRVIVRRVTILPDLRTTVSVEMEESSVELETIEVQAERPLIQKDLAATAYAIGEVKLDRLPVSSFREVLLLQPGTTVEGNVRGGKTTEVVFLVDGLPVQDVIGGGLGTNIPKSSITGLTIHTGGFEAEYGNALSGIVNVVTKGGGDKHALAVRYERDKFLPDNVAQQHDRAQEIEVTASGPVSGNAHYFTANTLLLSDTRWWQDLQRFFPSPVSKELAGLSKLEHRFSSALKIGVHAIYSVRDWHDYEFSWRFNLNGLPERTRNSLRLAGIASYALSEESFLTVSTSLYYLRSRIGSGSKAGLSQLPYQYDFYLQYIVSGERSWWADTRQMIYSTKADLIQQLNKTHLVKMGFEYNQYDLFSDVVKYEPQMSYFGKPLLDKPLLGYGNRYNYQPRTGSIYLQDNAESLEEGSKFSVGIRWDFLDPRAQQPLVDFIRRSDKEFQQVVTGKKRAGFKQQLSPRISFAAPIGMSSFLFVNFGHYFQFPLFDYLYSGINPSKLRDGAKNVLVGNPDLEPERTVAWEIGVKRGLTQHDVLAVTYFRKTMRNQIDSKTLIPSDSKAAGDYGFAAYVNNAEASASGLEFILSRERDDLLSGSLSYTYMVTEGISEYVDQSVNYAQWGFPLVVNPFPLSWDQRHTVKFDGSFVLPGEIHTNIVALYNTPRPYTYYPTRDGFSPADTSKAFIPNNWRMEEFIMVNAKFSKHFTLGSDGRVRVSLYADVRNLFNRSNIRWMDSSGRVGGELRDPGAYYDPRRLRVGIRMEY